MTRQPKISVVMAAYNAAPDLKSSVGSILNQTFTDFEFIIIDDGSTDKTREILLQFAAQDSRIKVIAQENTGLTVALNRGIAAATGTYIARQDADDVSYSFRLEKQLALIEEDPDVVLVGGNCDDVYSDGFTAVWGWYEPEELQRIVKLKTPFAHSTALMPADLCRSLGGYNESFITSQDMELWMRFAKKGKLAMVQEPILTRRITNTSISNKRRWRQFYDALRARWLHNNGLGRVNAVFYSFRSLLISLLPHRIIKLLRC